jgi:hypothetical protein
MLFVLIIDFIRPMNNIFLEIMKIRFFSWTLFFAGFVFTIFQTFTAITSFSDNQKTFKINELMSREKHLKAVVETIRLASFVYIRLF